MDLTTVTRRFIGKNQMLFKQKPLSFKVICPKWSRFLAARSQQINFEVDADFPVILARSLMREILGKAK